MKENKFIKNIVFGFGGQIVVMVLGIIIPRIMITSYGSDVNGIVSTVTQIFSYMALLEAGISQAAKNALYKHIANKDQKGISYVVSLSRRYFRKVTVVYGIGVMLLSFITPILLKSSVDKMTIFFIVFWEGLSGVISFYYIETDIALLTADGRGYVNNGINVVNKTISYIVKIVMAYFGMNIALLQFVYFFITIIKVVFYRGYVNKTYPWLRYDAAPKTAKLPDRNAYIVTEIAWTIFSSTDMIVLSTFVSTQLASVYSIYNLVFANINNLLSTVFYSINYLLGQTYHENIKRYEKMHDAFNSLFFGSMTALMCIAYILIIPFIKLYTNGVTDINYINQELPLLFCLVQLFSWSRYVTGALSSIAGYAKRVSYISLAEAIINITLSIALVHRYSIVGVLIATVVALPLKVIYLTWLSDKKILKRSYGKTIIILGVNAALFVVTVLLKDYMGIEPTSYGQFVVYGIVLTLVYLTLSTVLNSIANPDVFVFVRNKLKRM